MRQVRIEPAVSVLPAVRLRQLSAGQLARGRLGLHPGWRMVSSGYPILAAWRALLSTHPDVRSIAPAGTSVLLGPGSHGGVLLYELRPAELIFLRWLRAGRTVAEAAEAAEAASTAGPPFDARAAVIHLAGLGVFAVPVDPLALEASLAA